MNWQKSLYIIFTLILLISSCNKGESNKSDTLSKIEEESFKFDERAIYKELSEENLKKIPDDMLEPAILDYIDYQIQKNKFNLYETIKKLPHAFKVIYITYCFDEKVSSSGFMGFFMSQEQIFIEDLPYALKEIKAFNCEKVAKEALIIYNKYRDIFSSENVEKSLMSKAESELDRIDDIFYKTNEDLRQLRKIYIKDHLKDFVTK